MPRKNSNFPLYYQLFGLFLPYLSFKRTFSPDFYDYSQLIISSPPCRPLGFAPTLTLAFEHGTDTLALQPTSNPCLRLSPSDLRFKNVRDIPENLRRFSEKVQRFSEKLPRFLVKLRCLGNTLQPLCSHLSLFLTFHLAHNRSLLSASSCFCWPFPPRPQRGLLSLQPSSLTSLHNPRFYQGFLTRARAYTGIYIFSLSQPSQTSLITYYKSAISAIFSDNF